MEQPAWIVWVWLLFLGVARSEMLMGAMVTNTSQHNILEYAFVQGGSINISFSLLPDTASLNIVICSESDYYKLIENDHDGDLCNNKPKCQSNTYSQRGSGMVHYTTPEYGRYYVDVFACPAGVQEVTVNWSASFRNDRYYDGSVHISHLNADLLPVVPASNAAVLLWFAAAIAYLGTLRYHWKRSGRLQKAIAVYPIMKVVLSYYSGFFYSQYAEHGYFTTTEWVWFWLLQIGIKSAFGFGLMLLSITTTGLDSSRLKIRDLAFIFGITVGLLVIAALQCSYEVSQLSSLLMWMLSTTLYVMMLAFILSGITSGLQKAGTILRASIRRNISRRRLRGRRLRRLHASISSAIQPNSPLTSPNGNSLSTSNSHSNTNNNNNNNTEIQAISEENGTNASNDNSTFSAEQVTEINNSISYLMPYIWFMRYNLFISFKFVVIVWIVLNVVVYFVNLIFGTSPLNWVALMTNELLDFIIFSGIIYSFLMCSRSPFRDTKQDNGHHSQVYVPLLPTRSQQQSQLQRHSNETTEFEAGRGDQSAEIEDGEDDNAEGNEIEEDERNAEGDEDGEGELEREVFDDDGDDGDDGADGDDDDDEEVLVGRQLPIPGLII